MDAVPVENKPVSRFALWLAFGLLVSGGALSCLLWLYKNRILSPQNEQVLIVGPSMSPTLWGPHYCARCEVCAWQHRVHNKWIQRHHLELNRMICFRCGQKTLKLRNTLYLGDQATLVRFSSEETAHQLKSLKIGDLIVLEREAESFQVKRIAGLPGQVMTIDACGIIRADGTIVRPTLGEAWNRSVEVYTTKGLGNNSPGQRFHSMDDPGKPWQWEKARWQVELGDTRQKSQWLVYSHKNIHWEGRADVIRDDDPANIGLRRQTRPLENQGFFFELDLESGKTNEGWIEFILTHPSGVQAGVTSRILPGRNRLRVLCKDWIFFSQICSETSGGSLDRLTRIPQEAWDVDMKKLEPSEPLAMRVWGEGIILLHSIELRRPVRYDAPRQIASLWRQGITLGDNHWMVVGDNGPGSEDSRSTGRGVSGDRIVGRLLIAGDEPEKSGLDW